MTSATAVDPLPAKEGVGRTRGKTRHLHALAASPSRTSAAGVTLQRIRSIDTQRAERPFVRCQKRAGRKDLGTGAGDKRVLRTKPLQRSAAIRCIADCPKVEADIESVPRPRRWALHVAAVGCRWRRRSRRKWYPFLAAADTCVSTVRR